MGEYCAAACWASKLSTGGNEVCRRGCADEVVEAIEGLRDLVAPLGSASVGRCLGNANDDGPGGEVAEYGGEAMMRGSVDERSVSIACRCLCGEVHMLELRSDWWLVRKGR